MVAQVLSGLKHLPLVFRPFRVVDRKQDQISSEDKHGQFNLSGLGLEEKNIQPSPWQKIEFDL